MRAGGKHNDLDNVGYTRRHHTFFEMLGNFSFGDYFKNDAIAFAWELITKDYGLPKDKLYVTVFREDDDAEELWQKVAGVPKERIFRLDEKDNFWQMGETGPCGPCSEIHYDFGPEAGAGSFPDDPADASSRSGIWCSCSSTATRRGRLTPLPRPSIDTGMGLERIAAVMQGKLSNYDTDLIRPIMLRAGELFGKPFGEDAATDTVLRINADHARATAFLIHDGVLPSNEGRGYVLRKIMRRAMRNARMAGATDPYLYKLTGFVAEHMRDAYPEMMESVQRVARVVKDEEHRYATTFQVAERILPGRSQGGGGRRAAGRGGVQAVRHLRPGARRAGRHGSRVRADDRPRRLRGRDGEAAHARARELEGRGEGAGQRRLSGSAEDRVCRARDAGSSGKSGGCVRRRNRAGSHAVLRRGRRAGGRHGVLISAATGDTVAVVESAYDGAPGKTVHKVKLVGPVKEGDAVIAKVDASARAVHHAQSHRHASAACGAAHACSGRM